MIENNIPGIFQCNGSKKNNNNKNRLNYCQFAYNYFKLILILK